MDIITTNLQTEQILHRISKVDEIALYELIDEKLRERPEDSASVLKQKAARRQAFAEYMNNNTPPPRVRPKWKGPRRICYEQIQEILDITGISYFELLQKLSTDMDGNPIPVQWATEEEKLMCQYCDLLNPLQQKKVYEFIQGVLAPGFQDEELNGLSAILRLSKVTNLRSYCTAETQRQTSAYGLEKIYRRRLMKYSYNALELNTIAYAAEKFDISPHWLLSLDESHVVLAESGWTEKVMDLFCFLPDGRKRSLLTAVKTAITEGGF